MIAGRGLTKRYGGTTAVRDLSFYSAAALAAATVLLARRDA